MYLVGKYEVGFYIFVVLVRLVRLKKDKAHVCTITPVQLMLNHLDDNAMIFKRIRSMLNHDLDDNAMILRRIPYPLQSRST